MFWLDDVKLPVEEFFLLPFSEFAIRLRFFHLILFYRICHWNSSDGLGRQLFRSSIE